MLAPEHDAAQVQWGGDWRMPTAEEMDALVTKCDWTWTNRNGVLGCVVRGRGEFAEDSIFLPAASNGSGTLFIDSRECGRAWSSTPSLGSSKGLYFDSKKLFFVETETRFFGSSIRPVRGASDSPGGRGR